MGFSSAKPSFMGLVLMAYLLSQPCLVAQRTISVPAVGCASDGQVGPKEAPKVTARTVVVNQAQAHELAYYLSERGLGVLAPRGWYCFGDYGASGESLFVSPQPIDSRKMFTSEGIAFAGPAIQISHSLGDTSGRYEVASIIARVFPSYRSFVKEVASLTDEPLNSYQFGPFPNDVLNYKSKTVVEYKTPAHSDGLGTRSLLVKNDSAITGVAILDGSTPDLLLLAVRLPPSLAEVTEAIIRQLEWDVIRGFGSK